MIMEFYGTKEELANFRKARRREQYRAYYYRNREKRKQQSNEAYHKKKELKANGTTGTNTES